MSALKGLRILFAGSGAFGVPTLRRLVEQAGPIIHVYTQPEKPAGRGNKLTPTPIGALAKELGLPLTPTPDLNAETLPPADVLVVIAFGQKLSPAVVDHARLGAINLHSSRLPKYRGAAPINWAVINGDAISGNSVIRLAQQMDAGVVLGMTELAVGELETAGELHDRLSFDGADLVLRVLTELASGTSTPIEQDHAQATKAVKLSRELARVDWSRDARAIANQVRGMHPWPGCRVRLLKEDGTEVTKLTLIRGRAQDGAISASAQSAGTLSSDGTVFCGMGRLELIEIQPDGKKPMSLLTFRNGNAWEAGMRLESVR